MANFEYDTSKNDISFIRFGNNGAAGSESWLLGQKMKPYQIKKLKELLKTVEGSAPEPASENLEDMF